MRRAGGKVRWLGVGALLVSMAALLLGLRFVREPQSEVAGGRAEASSGMTRGTSQDVALVARSPEPIAAETLADVPPQASPEEILSAAPAGHDGANPPGSVRGGESYPDGPVLLAAGRMLSAEEFDALAARPMPTPPRGPEVLVDSRVAGMPPAASGFHLDTGREAVSMITAKLAPTEFIVGDASAGEATPAFNQPRAN